MHPRVKTVKPNPDYTLTLSFTNGEVRIFDVKPYLDRGIFQDLRDRGLFNSVKPFLGSIQWSGGQDFCPDTLYLDSIPIAEAEIVATKAAQHCINPTALARVPAAEPRAFR